MSPGCAASCAPAAPRGSASCTCERPAFRAVEHRCLPPAPSWARRWALACSCTATPCASCRYCAVRARTRKQRAANGPFALTLSVLAFLRLRPLGARRGRGPRWHGRLVRGCLGGAHATQFSRPPRLLPLHDPHLNTHARFSSLQERVTKEVADLEAKRAKRFAGARA